MTERALDAERKHKVARERQNDLEAVVQALSEQLQVSIRDRARLESKVERLTKRAASVRQLRESDPS